jgi:hypothetical protein
MQSSTLYCDPLADPTAAVPAVPGFPMMAAPSLVFQHPRRSRVSFRDTRMEVRIVSLACLSDELRSDIWYSPSDIESMRTEARDLCRFLRVNPQACPEEHTRGLELRISLERQCRKQLTVQGVVEAQRRCTDPAFLASLAQRCSMVPTEVAIAQAQRDYCNVYLNISGPPAPQLQQPQSLSTGDLSPVAIFASINHQNQNMPPPANLHMNHHNHYSQMNHPNHYTNNNNNTHNAMFAVGPPVAAAASADEEEEFDLCFEPIPLSAPDQSMMVLQGNKRMLNIFQEHSQERPVRRRLEGFPAA